MQIAFLSLLSLLSLSVFTLQAQENPGPPAESKAKSGIERLLKQAAEEGYFQRENEWRGVIPAGRETEVRTTLCIGNEYVIYFRAIDPGIRFVGVKLVDEIGGEVAGEAAESDSRWVRLALRATHNGTYRIIVPPTGESGEIAARMVVLYK